MIPFTKVQKQAKLVYNVRLVQGVEAGVEKAGKYMFVIQSQYYSHVCLLCENSLSCTLMICVPLHVLYLI